jgi:transcriptional regulator with XRE-family HTH domain
MVTPKMSRIAQTPNAVDLLRQQRGVSLGELARDTGIPRPTLTRKIRNGGLFTADELIAVSSRLSVEPSYWLAVA